MQAVITGDIIGYTRLSPVDREGLLEELKRFFDRVEELLPGTVAQFELVRGDSFQGLTQTQDGFRLALLIRCFLNTLTQTKTIGRQPLATRVAFNARIAVGYGLVDFQANRLAESDGKAFWYSGRLLDEMKGHRTSLQVKSDSPIFNDEMHVHCVLLEAIMSKWSTSQAQAVFEKLRGRTDADIADSLGTTRQAISLRVRHAGW